MIKIDKAKNVRTNRQTYPAEASKETVKFDDITGPI
jgi:hypothetical protein